SLFLILPAGAEVRLIPAGDACFKLDDWGGAIRFGSVIEARAIEAMLVTSKYYRADAPARPISGDVRSGHEEPCRQPCRHGRRPPESRPNRCSAANGESVPRDEIATDREPGSKGSVTG